MIYGLVILILVLFWRQETLSKCIGEVQEAIADMQSDDDDDFEVEEDAKDLFLSDLEGHSQDAKKFYETTGAIYAMSVGGDLYLMKPDGLFYKVEISAKKFRPTTDSAAQVTPIK